MRIEEYRKALSDNTKLERLKGTPDEWLLNDDAYVASVLRDTTTVTESCQTSSEDDLYTLDNLQVLDRYVVSLREMRESYDPFSTDEAHIGLDLAMLTMKTDKLVNSGRVSGTMSDLLTRTLNGFIPAYLDKVERVINDRREKGGARTDRIGFSPLDRSVVWDVYRYVMEQYGRDGDVMPAFVNGARHGAELAASRAKSGIYRWSDNYSRNSYWMDFQNSLDSGRPVRMDLFLASSYTYKGTSSLFQKTV